MRRLIPHAVRQHLRRIRHARAIRRGTFGDLHDPLFARLAEWVRPGDVVIDVGAAVGDYTLALSALVGPSGRVIALEPIADQMSALTENIRHAPWLNVTCLQVAAGEYAGMVYMTTPTRRGVPNWYEARISAAGTATLCTPLDDLPIPGPVAFIKVDAEGHDFAVLRGAERIIERDRPTLYIEANDTEMVEWLGTRGYGAPITAPGSPNRVFTHRAPSTPASARQPTPPSRASASG